MKFRQLPLWKGIDNDLITITSKMTSFQRTRQPANDPDELIQAEKGDFVGIDAIVGVEGE